MVKTLRLLFVEDSEDDAFFLQRELLRSGYALESERVYAEAEFRKAIEEKEWDAIIADYNLPQFSVLEALGMLQKRELDLPFIIVSGAIGEEVAVSAMKSGAHDYILKNSLARLVPAIEREIRDARTRRERKKAEESCLRLAAIVESSGDAIIGRTLDGTITSWNQGAAKMFGYASEEVLGKTIQMLFPTDRVSEEAWLVEQLKLGKQPLQYETVRVRKGGRRIDVSVTISPIADASGNVVGASKIARDITERKRVENYVTVLSKLGQSLSSALSPIEAGRVIAEAAGDIFGWDAFTLDLYSPEKDEIQTVLNVDTIGGKKQDVPSTYQDKKPSSLARRIIETGGKLILRKKTENAGPGTIPFGEVSRASASLMFVPVRNQSRVIGVLSIQSYSADIYEQRDLGTFQTLADYCGGALERIHVREALVESEFRFRKVIESDLVGVFFWRVNGEVSEANDKFLSMTGFSREDLNTGRLNWLNMTPPEYLEADRKALIDILATGSCKPIEKEYICKDGRRIPILIGAASLRTGQDEGVCFVVDITERKRSEEALRRSEERFRKLADVAPIGILEHDEKGRCIYANSRWATISGLSSEESAGEGWLSVLHPEDREMVESDWRSAIGAGREWMSEHRLLTRIGLVHWVRAQAEPILNKEGKSIGFVGILEDITRNKRAAEALRAAQDRLQHLVSSSPAVIYALKVHGNALLPAWVSENITQMMGYAPQETLSSKWWADNLQLEEDAEALGFGSVFSEQDRLVKEYPLRRKDGTDVWIRDEKRLLRDAGGKLVEVVGSWTDITERKRAEQELRTSREELRALAANLQSIREEERKHITREIHDELGQSLTGFKMDLAWMRGRLSGNDLMANRQAVLDKIGTMSGLIDETANLVRKLCTELRPGVLDDLGLVAAIEWQIREYESRTGIRCSREIELADMVVDSERSTALFRIFQEILTNVARHARASRVEVSLRREETEIVLEVKDNGRGIKESEKAGTKSLGLLGMRERALVIGGAVEITGQPGRGTTVRVRVPVLGGGSEQKTEEQRFQKAMG